MEKDKEAFSEYNPIVNFIFFTGVIVFGMFFIHPAFLICSWIFSSSYYIIIKGTSGIKFIASMIPLFLILSLINPLFNTYGAHVLFVYLKTRPYTLEALYYGMALSSMIISILIWFGCYNSIMTSDKFLYIFARFIPSISMILTMILRMVPEFQRKISDIQNNRKCIGKYSDCGKLKSRLKNGASSLSAVTTWALEGSIVTADSMKSRGYGTVKRTNFSIYRFHNRDKIVILIMIILTVFIGLSWIYGGTYAKYTPVMDISPISNPFSILGVVSYGIFLSIPIFINVKEAVMWRYLRSRI